MKVKPSYGYCLFSDFIAILLSERYHGVCVKRSTIYSETSAIGSLMITIANQAFDAISKTAQKFEVNKVNFWWLLDRMFLAICLVKIDCHHVKEKPHSSIVCSLKQAFQLYYCGVGSLLRGCQPQAFP